MAYGENKIVRVIRGRRPKIVVIGGGTGLPVILNALKEQNADITAIVTVADDGGSSGAIRDYINVVPPGDIRNVLVSLSDLPQEEKDIFNTVLIHLTHFCRSCNWKFNYCRFR